MIHRLIPIVACLAISAAACSPVQVGDTTTLDSAPEVPSTVAKVPSADATEPVETEEDPTATEGDAEESQQSFAGTTPAPEFPGGLDWLNVAAPLDFASLQGKAVLLDFWTYGCINCIHIIPDLHRLEEEYPDELVVIGVHSAKFLNEGETDNIRQVVLRYDIEHPVVNDRDFEVWQSWGANAWPTVVLIDPVGNVVGSHAGEGVYNTVQPVLESLINEFDAKGLIDRSPLVLSPEAEGRPDTVLAFPGKVAVDDTGAKLFIADTGHNRVLVVDAASGTVTAVFGAESPGFVDGVGINARFNAPQGLTYDAATDTLYVADTNNHAVRQIDLDSGSVSVFAGTGSKGWPPTGGAAPDVALASPWGLTLHEGVLYIAMAGTHQIWNGDLTTRLVEPIVGNARESTLNGPLGAAELAQPSGLTFDDTGLLYFADSESSSIRSAEVLNPEGVTETVAGSDQNLFDFGDEDGNGVAARLQHPLGVAYDQRTDTLYVADTYNSKIKRIDLDTNDVATAFGVGQGWEDGKTAQFSEPGGLALAGDTLYVADTNNHVIRSIDLATGVTSTLVLGGIEVFNPPPGSEDYTGAVILLEEASVAAGPGTVSLDIELPDSYKVNEQAPSSALLVADSTVVSTVSGSNTLDLTGTTLPFTVPVTLSVGSSDVQVDVTLIYCRNDAESLCYIEQLRLVRPVVVGEGVGHEISLPYTVALPDGF